MSTRAWTRYERWVMRQRERFAQWTDRQDDRAERIFNFILPIWLAILVLAFAGFVFITIKIMVSEMVYAHHIRACLCDDPRCHAIHIEAQDEHDETICIVNLTVDQIAELHETAQHMIYCKTALHDDGAGS